MRVYMVHVSNDGLRLVFAKDDPLAVVCLEAQTLKGS
jgi:hypothetical protein